jgi:hypothetical protein
MRGKRANVQPGELAIARPVSRRKRGTWGGLWRRPVLLIWCLFLLLSPLYVFGVGLPQPGDMLLFLLAPLAVFDWDRRFDKTTARTIKALVWFTLWVTLVNYTWAVVLWKWTNRKDFIIHPLYYLFNLLVFVSAMMIAHRDRRLFLRATVYVAFLTIFVQVVASFFYRTDLYRGELFFDSPNQLGYYALLCACLFAMTQKPLGIPRLWSGIGVTCCAYLGVLSASRASLAGILVLLFVLVFSNPRTIIIGSLVALALISLGGPLSNALDAAEARTTHERDPKTTFAEERGYDRIWEHPEYLGLGAGEGDYARFAKPGEHPREMHSSFGSIAFSYGLVGVALFALFFWRVVKGAPLRSTLMMVPALLYTVAHQGLRFPMFWVVLAVFAVMKQIGPPERKK